MKAFFKLIIAFFILGAFQLVSNFVDEWPTTISVAMLLAAFVANSQDG